MSRTSRASLGAALSLAAIAWGGCGTTPPAQTAEPAQPVAQGSETTTARPGETTVVAERVEPPPESVAPKEIPKAQLVEVANLGDTLATTTAVSREGRKFISFPRWFKDNEAPQQVGELNADGTVAPFPDAAWNAWAEGQKPRKKLVCVQSVVVDGADRLWILDTGAPYWGKVLKGAAKLVGVDLETNEVIKTIAFDAKIAPEGAYLNDVRIDPNGKLAYLSDSNLGRIVVVDLKTGKSRVALEGSPGTKFEEGVVPTVEGVALKLPDGSVFKVNVDGIAIAGDYLYFHAVTGKTMYRIKLDLLRDKRAKAEAVEAGVETVAQTGVHDGIAADPRGNVYLTQLEQNAISVLRADGTQETLISDARLQWPDSIGVGDDGLYVTVSQVHLLPVFNGGQSARKNPYRVFRVTPADWQSPTAKRADPAPAESAPAPAAGAPSIDAPQATAGAPKTAAEAAPAKP